METLHAFIWLQIILSMAHGGLGLLSDYKTCGDPACERMMSRVQALQDHHTPDCRFLSFRKGDMILVYFKLTGRRSDLWAGSIDKQSGYFPKDAVRIDEVFVEEEKEIKMPTQKFDFYCMDEFGSIIENDSNEIDDQDDLIPESEVLGIDDFDDILPKSTETNHQIQTKEAIQSPTQEPSPQDPEESEKHGSSWIGSVNGWFGSGEKESHEEPPEDGSEESFKGRKLALDMDENQLHVEDQAETLGWIGNGLTNVFGFGKKALKDDAKDSPEEVNERSPSMPSSWLDMGMKDILGFTGGDNPVKSEAEDSYGDQVPHDENVELTDSSRGGPSQGEKQEAPSPIEENVDPAVDLNTASGEIRGKEDSGWYGSVYDKITNLYGDTKDQGDVSIDGGGDSLSEEDVQPPVPNTEDVEDAGGEETDAGQSLFSVDRLSTVFDGLKSRFQSDTSEEDRPPEQTDAGKEAFDDRQIDKDEESTGDDEINRNSAELISETKPLSDEKLTLEVSSFSGDVGESGDFSQEPNKQGDEADESKEAEIPEEKPTNDVFQTETNGSVDSNTSNLAENQTEERFPSEGPPDEPEGKADFDLNADHAQPYLSTDQREDIQTVLNGEQTTASNEELKELTEENISNGADQSISNTDSHTVTLDTLEALQLENLKLEIKDKMDVPTPESREDQVIAKEGDKDDDDPKTDGLSSHLISSPQEDPTSETGSASTGEVAQDKDEEILLLDPKTNEFSSYSETDSGSSMTDVGEKESLEESEYQELDESTLGSGTEQTESAAETESVEVTQGHQDHLDIPPSSEEGEGKEEWKCGNDPDGSKLDGKLADVMLGQPKETAENIPSTQSPASEPPSGVSNANGEYSDHVSLAEGAADQTVLDISPDSSDDILTSEESGIPSENEHEKGFEYEEPIQNASEDASTLERELSNHVSLTKDANTDDTLDVSLDSTKNIPTSEVSGIFSENENQKELQGENFIQNESKDANTLEEEQTQHVSLAEGASTDHATPDISLDVTEDILTSEESGILSENENPQESHDENPIQNASELANTLEEEQSTRVSLAEDANTDHTTLDISLDGTKDVPASEESEILPKKNENLKPLEDENSIQNADENANTIEGKHSNHVSLAKDSNSKPDAFDISRDNTEDNTTSEESVFLSENEKHELTDEKPFKNASELANTLEEEQSNRVSLAEEANTDQTTLDISLDGTKDVPASKESGILPENENLKPLEDENSIQNASKDANTLKGEHSNHVGLAEDANKDHTTLDLNLDSTEDIPTSEESGNLSGNENQKKFEYEEPIQNDSEDANTLEGGPSNGVNLAKDANTHYTTPDVSLGSNEDIPTSKESGILSENGNQNESEDEKPVQKAGKDANPLEGKPSNHVSLTEDANTDHTTLDASLDNMEDSPTSKESGILSKNENQNKLEDEKLIQTAGKDANTLEGALSHHVGRAEDGNTTLDLTENTPKSEESANLSDNENQKRVEEPIPNASEDANTLNGKHSKHDILAKDSNSNHAAHGISHDSTEDDTASEESRILSENEFEHRSEDANPREHDNDVELKLGLGTSSLHTAKGKKNDGSIIDGPTSNTMDIQTHSTAPAEEPQTPPGKEYPNLQADLSEEDIMDLLEVFGEHRISWLDQTLGRDVKVGPGQGEDRDDLSWLIDFEQRLEYYMKTGTRNKGGDASLLVEAFAKVHTLLSTLREKLMPVVADGSVDKGSDLSRNQRADKGYVNSNKGTPDSKRDSLSADTVESLIKVPDEQGLSEGAARGDSETEDVQILDRDAATSDRKTTSGKTESDSGVVEPEGGGNGNQLDLTADLFQYAAFLGEVTSDTFAYVLKEGAHLQGVIYEVLTMAEEFKSESAVTEASDVGGTARIYYTLALEKIRDVVSSLPDDIRPGPDLYGLPWEVVLSTAILGLFVVLLFSCRFIHSVSQSRPSIKSRLYASKERRMGQKVAELLEEKCKVLETLSECKHKFEKLDIALQNGGVSAQASERENLEAMSKKLEQSNAEMVTDIERLQEELENQSKFRKQQEEQLAELEATLKSLEKEAKEHKSQLEQDKTTLKIYEMNSERLQKKLQEAKEESTMLLESKAQLVHEAEGWGERLSELEEEMRMCERSHSSMVEDCTNKDERIKSLTDHLLKMKDWDSEEESSVDGSSGAAGSENGDSLDLHQKQKVQKLIFAAKMSADLKAMEEDKDRVFAKLADEIKAKEDLQEGIEQMHKEKESLESESSMYSDEIQKLQQKLQIMTEMYQENELKLHRMLTVEERERSQKEEKLTKAGKKISLAAEELNTYRQRAKELEDELERTNQAYKNQVASHEKKAHDNWLAARAADRDLADVKRENSLLRQRLTDYQFKLELMEKDPYARVGPGKPLFRGERSPYGPSPLGRPSSETRAFLSPPTLMDGPPRLSPQFPMVPGGRVSRGVVEPPAGGLEGDRSGPLSDSGSASPSWERERRGPGAPPGLPPPDPGMPYRRPPPGPFPMGPLPPRPPPPDSYFGDKPDLPFLGNSSGSAENESRDGLHSVPADLRPPPDVDMRVGPLPMGLPPPMDPRDPLLPRRMPYGPPDYFPPRGPGGPPLGMRGPPPPGMLRPLPHPMAFPPMRPPPDGFLPGPPLGPPPPDSFQPGPPLRQTPPDSFQPGPPPRPPPQGSEQPPEQAPSPHDVI
ncbi:hypothetical protein NFI96_018919 [Prochilodus magdalenae]|nr:hypothetical protein NFI96_018919 [Prochilodus magdalenae]